MDWVKVAQALDDEWWQKKQTADQFPNRSDAGQTRLLGAIAFMLRDCLVAGMNEKDKERSFDRSGRDR